MEKKSNGLLKVTGILMIIGGGLMISLGFAAITTALMFIGAFGFELSIANLAPYLQLAGAALTLVAGIIGVVNAAKPEKATVCIVFGILSVCLSLLSVLGGIAESEGGVNIFGNLIFGLAVPILYLIGAFQNKKRQSAGQA